MTWLLFKCLINEGTLDKFKRSATCFPCIPNLWTSGSALNVCKCLWLRLDFRRSYFSLLFQFPNRRLYVLLNNIVQNLTNGTKPSVRAGQCSKKRWMQICSSWEHNSDLGSVQRVFNEERKETAARQHYEDKDYIWYSICSVCIDKYVHQGYFYHFSVWVLVFSN